MKTARLFIILFLVIPSVRPPSFAGQDDIKKKQSQLQGIRKEIDAYEAKIKEREKKEHATLELLDTYDRQTTLLRKLINKLHDQESLLEADIAKTKESIGNLNTQVKFLKQHYAKYVSTAYKTGRTYDLELLLASKSFNEMLVRSEYLRRFSEKRKKDVEVMNIRRAEMERQNSLLKDQLSEQRQIITDKAAEKDKLSAKMNKRKTVLTEIRRDKKNLQKELNRKIQDEKEMQKLIAKLIEDERKRKEREAKKPRESTAKPPEKNTAANGSFEARRGTFRWPVENGRVVARFGTQQHPVLKTVTKNTGIDISIPSGSSVAAIADGEVSTVWWLPSFGNLVIVSHTGGYRTVYAHLSEIVVNEGDRINEGKILGRSGEALSGPLLHFEIWKDRDNQDPERWLRSRGVSQR